MFNFLKKLFSSNEDALLEAVLADDVPKAYKILSTGNVNVNKHLFTQRSEYEDNDLYHLETCDTCLLMEAKSEAMTKLLTNFGALPLNVLKDRWKAEERK